MSKFIDITGQRFGNITILRRVENNKDGRVQFEYQCDCGNIKVGRSKDIREGKITSCGCKKVERMKQNTVDITGNKYNHLTAIEYGYTKNKKPFWLFKCDCGNYVYKNKESVINGNVTSCGCMTPYEIGNSHRIYEKPGTIYNYLQVIKPAFDECYSGPSIYWYKCLLCGREIVANVKEVRFGTKKSCGCLLSFKEKEISAILEDNNIPYKSQYMYDDLRSEKNRMLRFDFALLNEKQQVVGLIEYQGSQHYNDRCGDFGRQQREVTDKQKQEYCLKNNIPLLILNKDNINLKEDILNFYNEVINNGRTT